MVTRLENREDKIIRHSDGDYGRELSIDIHGVSSMKYGLVPLLVDDLCGLLDVERGSSMSVGGQMHSSFHQVITSDNVNGSITMHFAPELKQLHVNIFSVKWFNDDLAIEMITDRFGGRCIQSRLNRRP